MIVEPALPVSAMEHFSTLMLIHWTNHKKGAQNVRLFPYSIQSAMNTENAL